LKSLINQKIGVFRFPLAFVGLRDNFQPAYPRGLNGFLAKCVTKSAQRINSSQPGPGILCQGVTQVRSGSITLSIVACGLVPAAACALY